MALTQLVFLSFACPLGIVYLYLGIMRKDRVLAAGGAILALYPLFFTDARVLAALFIMLSAAPFAARKLLSRKSAKG